MTFNERLKALRNKKNIGQKDIAQALGIERSTYTKYETGKSEPDFEMVKKLADFFKVSVDYLLGRDEAKKEKQNGTALTEGDMKEIKQKAENIKSTLMGAVDLAFYGSPNDEETLEKVMKVLEKGTMLAKEEAKEKYTPKNRD
ncbi:MAG: helix-turn-helix domain-containing protein [Clostridiales bacterium]|nr:helix-turn-helix domain-containing protein [Clostridiales bacterium]HBM79340.1 transcriptional regulator [Clostridiaceae bacterium]